VTKALRDKTRPSGIQRLEPELAERVIALTLTDSRRQLAIGPARRGEAEDRARAKSVARSSH
jgi:hypothetical protein